MATVTIVDDEKALTVSQTAPAGHEASALTSAELESAVRVATAQWLALDPDADFSGITFVISDLADNLLGLTEQLTITIDATAAGWGWTTKPGGAPGRVDLVTVVFHELGHALGLDHEDDGLMAAEFAVSRDAAARYGAGRLQAHPCAGPGANRGPRPASADQRSGAPAAAGSPREDGARWVRPSAALGPAPYCYQDRNGYPERVRRLTVVAALLAALSFAPSALADDWLPHAKDATWTYEWTESVYNPTPTKEKVTVSESSGAGFTLNWTTSRPGQPGGRAHEHR